MGIIDFGEKIARWGGSACFSGNPNGSATITIFSDITSPDLYYLRSLYKIFPNYHSIPLIMSTSRSVTDYIIIKKTK
jgi:hypothetical protein